MAVTYASIKAEFESEGYMLLSTEYVGCEGRLNYICPEGHTGSTCRHRWGRGQRCKKCGYNSAGKKLQLKIKDIKENFSSEGYILLTKVYTRNTQRLDFICPKGHKYYITWLSWKQGGRCAVCSGTVRHTIDFIKYNFEQEGYTLLTKDYINNKQKLDYICSAGHKHSITWNDWSAGYRCPICWQISITGPNSLMWKGGYSKKDYCPIFFDKEYKEDIMTRDGHTCQNPCCCKKDNVLSVHHIDYDKKNCGPDNLITICRTCNARANADRAWHTSWYQTIMNHRYKYVYNK